MPPVSLKTHDVPPGHVCQVADQVLQSRMRQPSAAYLHWRYLTAVMQIFWPS